jgi:hypothetical protein
MAGTACEIGAEVHAKGVDGGTHSSDSHVRRSSPAALVPTQPGAETQATRLVKHSIIAIEAGDVAIDDEAAAEEDPLSQLRTAAEAAIQPPGTPDAGESETDNSKEQRIEP